MASGSYDVVVVGCGPVGCVTAILLAQQGHRVAVLERWPEPYRLPRAVHFDDETGRILQACGIGPALGAISEAADVYEWRNGAGTTLLRIGRAGPGPSGWPQSSMFNQPALEELLVGRARSLDHVDLRRGVTVRGLRADGEGVAVDYTTTTGAAGVVRAASVVGCDGANSTVRDLIGSPVTDLGFAYDWLIVDVVLDQDRTFDPPNLQICDPRRPTTAVSGGPGRRRWEFMRLPGETLEELHRPGRAWELLAPWGVRPDNATLERHAVYTFQARWADRWRSGRVFLAGDAAHQMPPFAGQGMCAGLRDAANLSWKLGLVLQGGAAEGLLDTYQGERMDHMRSVIDFSMALSAIICVADPGEAAERDAHMAAAVTEDPVEVPPLPGIAGGLRDATSPAAGSLFIQGTVEREGRRCRLDDAVGAGWRIVQAPPGGSLPAELAQWFASIGGASVTVGPGGDVGDPDGTYGRWFAEHGVAAAVQRPDFHLYGTAADLTGLGSLLDELRRRLRSGPPGVPA